MSQTSVRPGAVGDTFPALARVAPAGIGRRALARLLDVVVGLATCGALTVIAVLGPDSSDPRAVTLVALVVQAVAVVLALGVLVAFVLTGLLPGGAVLGLRQVRVSTGGPPGPAGAVKYLVLGVLTAVTFGLGYLATVLTVPRDRWHRSWVDRWLGLMVIDIREGRDPRHEGVGGSLMSDVVPLAELAGAESASEPAGAEAARSGRPSAGVDSAATRTPTIPHTPPDQAPPPHAPPPHAPPEQEPSAQEPSAQGIPYPPGRGQQQAVWPLPPPGRSTPPGTPPHPPGPPAALHPPSEPTARPYPPPGPHQAPAPHMQAPVGPGAEPTSAEPPEGPGAVLPGGSAGPSEAGDRGVPPAPGQPDTRVNPQVGTEVKPVRVRLPDGTAVLIDGPTAFGRNPVAPPGHPDARLVPLVDPGRSVSKTHAVLTPQPGGVLVEDLHSTNGTSILTGRSHVMVPAEVRLAAKVGWRVALAELVLVIEDA